VVRGAEEERLNHGGSRPDMWTPDLDNLSIPLGGGGRETSGLGPRSLSACVVPRGSKIFLQL
jgi:hypothetical protein